MAQVTDVLSVWVLFLCSTKSKKRKSLVISAPIPCNTAFPSSQSSAPSTPHRVSTSDDQGVKMDTIPDETTGQQQDSTSDLESVSLTDSDTPSTHRLSISSEGEAPRTPVPANENGPQNAETAQLGDGSSKQREDARLSMDLSKAQVVQQAEGEEPKSPGAEKPKRPPLPTPRLSLTPSEVTTPPSQTPASSNGQEEKEEEKEEEEEEGQQKQQADVVATDSTATADATETATTAAVTEESSGTEGLVEKTKVLAPLPVSDSDYSKPPGFLYKVSSLAQATARVHISLVCGLVEVMLQS